MALGDFKQPQGTGYFAAYFVGQRQDGSRHLRRLRKVNGVLTVESFGTLLQPNTARCLEFDPVSGDLFVSEAGSPGRIFRFNKDGQRSSFGESFKEPNGMAFHPSGVMLVTEDPSVNEGDSNMLVVEGWRNKFKRGDANGDGTVEISDPIFIQNYVNLSGPVPPCLDGADANDDSKVLQSDADFLFRYLFQGGQAPPVPGPNTCGRDPSADLLDCIQSLGAGCAIPFRP